MYCIEFCQDWISTRLVECPTRCWKAVRIRVARWHFEITSRQFAAGSFRRRSQCQPAVVGLGAFSGAAADFVRWVPECIQCQFIADDLRDVDIQTVSQAGEVDLNISDLPRDGSLGRSIEIG